MKTYFSKKNLPLSENQKSAKLTSQISSKLQERKSLFSEENKLSLAFKEKKEEVEEIDPEINNDNSKARIIQKKKNVYDSIDEDEISDEEVSPYVIPLASAFRSKWDILIIVCIIYTIIVLPFRIAFDFEPTDLLAIIIEGIMDLFFIIDLGLNFFFSYKNASERQVLSLKKTSLTYLKTWFLLDFVSSIPFTWISLQIQDNNSTNIDKFESFAKIARLYKMSKWIRILRIFKIINKKVSLNSEETRNFYDALAKIGIFLFVFLIVLHTFSCVFIFIGFSDNYTNWIRVNDLEEKSEFDIYIASIYYHMVTIFSIGYGDIELANLSERFYTCFFLCIGLFLYSFTLSFMSTYFSNKDNRTIQLESKLNILEDINTQYPMNELLYKKIKKHIKEEFKRIVLERYKLLETLPNKYRNDLIYCMHSQHIKELQFLKNQSHDFIIFVLPKMKPLRLVKHDILFGIGEFLEEMYLVTRGKLSLKCHSELGRIEVASIRQNFNFGELYMHRTIQSPFTMENNFNCTEVLVFKKQDFNEARVHFVDNINQILDDGVKLVEIIKKRMSLIISLINYTSNLQEIRNFLRDIDIYILKEGFSQMFYEDKDFEELKDNFLKEKYDEILEKMNFKTSTIKSENKIIYKTLLENFNEIDSEINEFRVFEELNKIEEINEVEMGRIMKRRLSLEVKPYEEKGSESKKIQSVNNSETKSGILQLVSVYSADEESDSENYSEEEKDYVDPLNPTNKRIEMKKKSQKTIPGLAIGIKESKISQKKQKTSQSVVTKRSLKFMNLANIQSTCKEESFTLGSNKPVLFKNLQVQRIVNEEIKPLRQISLISSSAKNSHIQYTPRLSNFKSLDSPSHVKHLDTIKRSWTPFSDKFNKKNSESVGEFAKYLAQRNRDSHLYQEYRQFDENIEKSQKNASEVKSLVMQKHRRMTQNNREMLNNLKKIDNFEKKRGSVVTPSGDSQSFEHFYGHSKISLTNKKQSDQPIKKDSGFKSLNLLSQISKNERSIKIDENINEEKNLSEHYKIDRKLDALLEKLKNYK